MTGLADRDAAVELLRAWMARGNHPGGMNVPDYTSGTPSIQPPPKYKGSDLEYFQKIAKVALVIAAEQLPQASRTEGVK